MKRWVVGIVITLGIVSWMSYDQLKAYVVNREWGAGVTSVTYYINPTSKYITPAAAIAAIQLGANAWNDQTQANMTLVYGGTTPGGSLVSNSKNEVFFRNESNGSLFAMTVYHWNGAGEIVDFDIVFYELSYKFFTGTSGCVGGVYVEDGVTHEFGHGLGLGHTTVAGATMRAAMPAYCDQTWRTLASDDISGLEFMYPPSGSPPVNTAPSVSISSPLAAAVYAHDDSITFTGTATDTQDGSLTSSLIWSSSIQGQIGTGATFSRTLLPGVHTITARATDSGGLLGTASVSISVSAASGPVLTVRAYKTKGYQKADLSWANVGGVTVDIYRDGVKRFAAETNDGAYTDTINAKGGGRSYRYKVCPVGQTTGCTNEALAVF